MQALAENGLAKPPATQPALRRQLAKLDASVGEAEPVVELRPFLEKSRSLGVLSLPRYELNRVLRGAWFDPEFDVLGMQAVDRASMDQRRSSDQAMIDGYLSYFPVERAVISPLASAAQRAADRYEWAWRERGSKWRLFEPDQGPAKIADEFVKCAADGVSTLLLDTGLGLNLAASSYGQATFSQACYATARLSAEKATAPQQNLLNLFDDREHAGQLDLIVRALLEPWIDAKPSPEHRKVISEVLLDQVGDPRMQKSRWDMIVQSLSQNVGEERAGKIVQVFKRWLTDVAMREFFRAIAKTTDRPDQWAQRASFWLAYLDEGLVTDAWPALGVRARNRIEDIIRQSGERPEYGIIRGGPSSSSSIIMQIGDSRISEWSDNGSCRFWNESDPNAPKLYVKTYDGGKLRTTAGRTDFEFTSHVPQSPGWEGKFAGIIYRRTAIAHPKFGRGRSRYRGDTW
ncbi:MAG: hypothetical protein KUG65_13300 [Sphingomonadaceae bacterium]|nr:hypothetical protein [Sphingomonadaceae bacterium]